LFVSNFEALSFQS